MKIRIKGNSVRYRLTKTEVETFCKTGYYEERTEFNTKTFTYALKAVDVDNLGAEFMEDTVTLLVPKKWSSNWFENNRVGFENTMILNNKSELFLLVEKDFACLDNTTEDQSDNYPNPKAC
ncbi:DUF7009 family protein [Flagellimonas algicola]|uniref:Uncharacterized protein n=1 Tax=Flagellimonas algicola TaxID=2583815 RepID=A0ABY2WMD8_9FLAO|nr:hypothetical protein [Allomuricauda algicola]TMU56146.1 hypothetical protein FGG15_00995 [Allomuricauda algicola]